MAAIPTMPRLDIASWSSHLESTQQEQEYQRQQQFPFNTCQIQYTSVVIITPPISPFSPTFNVTPNALDNDMSSATTTALEQPSSSSTSNHTTKCQQCGANLSHAAADDVSKDAQIRISELEQQVKFLTAKATAAADKLADYEDELRNLKKTTGTTTFPSPTVTTHPPSRPSSTSSVPMPTPIPQAKPALSRISSLLPTPSLKSRRTTSQPPSAPASQTNFSNTNNQNPSPSPSPSSDPNNSHASLLALLTQEKTLRQAAESRVAQTQDEIEELSAQLFTEANEMVAMERKARARLEERVIVLEKRDREKRGRLEVLEQRLGRIERVRGMIGGL